MHCIFYPYTLEFKRPAGTSRGTLRIKETFLLRLSDGSRVGWGECGPVRGLSVDDTPALTARLAHVCQLIDAGTPLASLDVADWPALAFGLETAWLDLHRGGPGCLFDTPFCRGEQTLPTHGLIWMDTPAGIMRQIGEKAARGFRCIKMKVGALPFAEEMALLRDIRRAFPAPTFELRLDANGAFDPHTALEQLEQLASLDIHFIEQPIQPGARQPDGWQAMARLCAESAIPIALDEELIGVHAAAQRRALLDTIRPQHLILKPTLLGGLRATEAWIELAEARGSAWWINSALESNVGLNAICQWLAQRADARVHGLGTGQLYTNNIPSPLRLAGAGLRYDPAGQWDFGCVTGAAPAGHAPTKQGNEGNHV